MRAIDADAISYESIDSCDTGRHEHYYGTGIIAVRKEDIDAMPTIQPEPHWIPVTKPPTDRMICYVTLKDTKDESRQNWVAEMIYTPWDGFDLMDGVEAIAWMPKQYPEPYKGGE